jgi:hypothetical protein
MTVVRFEYASGGHTVTVDFDHLDVPRVVVTTRRKQAIKQLENRKFLQYILGSTYKEISCTFDQTYETLAKILQLKDMHTVIDMYYKYARYPTTKVPVKINPNFSVSYAAGHLGVGEITVPFVETTEDE